MKRSQMVAVSFSIVVSFAVGGGGGDDDGVQWRRYVHLGKHTQEGGKVGATTTKTRCSREQQQHYTFYIL